jgi:uncharacterized protein YndB with AHSA1/START domain
MVAWLSGSNNRLCRHRNLIITLVVIDALGCIAKRMTMEPKNKLEEIKWRLHLSSPPEEVFQLLATDRGREQFWAESAKLEDGGIVFRFPNGVQWQGEILNSESPHRYQIVYYGGTITTFELVDDDLGGTDLTLTDQGVLFEDRSEVLAGWVSVLMALKAAADFGVDLRNHDPSRTWDQKYIDN